jgi:multiple sugar transport system ATP-binding protein
MAQLSIKNLVKRYGTIEVVHGINLEIADKEFVALVGPSGCGKSTTLRMIAGLESISDGALEIGGKLVNDLPPRDRNISMVFQSYALYPHMSVRENMGFSLKIAKQPQAEIDRRVNEASAILGLEALMERRPAQLSGGQRQRVAMGRAVVRDPSVFLFDEPLSNLDAKLRVQMRTEIKALHKKVGVTSVYVTHDQVEAMTLADRVVVLNRGVIQQAGSPMELYRQPANLFVAGFIGSPAMNFFDATVIGNTARTAGGEVFAFEPGAGVADAAEVVVGIRPEHIQLGSSGIAGQVSFVEPTGGQTFVTVEISGVPVVVTVSGEHIVNAGDTVSIAASPRQTYVFDRASGGRVSKN